MILRLPSLWLGRPVPHAHLPLMQGYFSACSTALVRAIAKGWCPGSGASHDESPCFSTCHEGHAEG